MAHCGVRPFPKGLAAGATHMRKRFSETSAAYRFVK